MQVQKIKPKKNVIQTPPKFISPLQKYINENCKRCPCYVFAKGEIKGEFSCGLINSDTIDLMLLCMMASNLQGAPTTDPKEIFAEAEKTLAALLNGNDPTPDEHPETKGLALKREP